MVDRKEITIVILPNGEISMTTRGYKGSECEEALKSFEKELGPPTKKTRTSEYYEQAATPQKKKATAKTK